MTKLMTKSQIFTAFHARSTFVVAIVIAATAQIYGQSPIHTEQAEDLTLWYLLAFILIVLLIGAIFWRYKAGQSSTAAGYTKVEADKGSNNDELAWLRQNGRNQAKNGKKNGRKNKQLKVSVDLDDSYRAPLPVFTFRELKIPANYDPLPVSNDPELMNAIEHVSDEVEEDDKTREIFLHVLADFKNQNSVEAVSEVALYDLSANLRSQALGVLTDMDHESVFETVLLACADPTREVRAAAARALFRLNFNRADAWSRIALSGEQGRMVQAARAAIEGDLVERSFDRLVHKDTKYAYEAFALLYLLIKAGETDLIFDTLKNHHDINVRNAILHIFKTTKDEKALDTLSSILEDKSIKPEVQKEITKTIDEFDMVAA